jgi:hypothetical protein
MIEPTSQVLLNSENYDTETNTFRVNFGKEISFSNTQIAAAQISAFNSFGNISQELANNTLTIYWPNGASYLAFPITIADGYYSTKTFFAWLKEKMDERYLYTLSGTTKTYPIFMGTNNSYQNISFFYTIATDAIIHASATWTLPSVTSSPYVVWPASLGKLFGFSATTVGTGAATNYVTSDIVPEQNSVNSIIISCNMVNNYKITKHRDLLSTFPVAATEFGNIINRTYSKLDWMNIADNSSFNEIEITFRDQNYKKLSIHDVNILILLAFRKRKKE